MQPEGPLLPVREAIGPAAVQALERLASAQAPLQVHRQLLLQRHRTEGMGTAQLQWARLPAHREGVGVAEVA